MKKKKVVLNIIAIAILIVSVVGVSMAFFNYTRTGAINNIGTGRIYFNSTQNGQLNLTNIFPMTSSEALNANLDTVTVGIVGDTTYADGEEFEISLVNVTNTINGKSIPINYIASYEATTGNSIGVENDTYWESRNSKNADIYLLNTTGEVEEGKQVLVGYIKNSATGINGTLTIKAYIDADRIAISDTYDSANPGTDNMGTTSTWVNGRTVFTTTEWNSFQNSGTPISFKIRAESNEGIWVQKQVRGIDSCPGCVFAYSTTGFWTTWNPESETPSVLTSSDYSTNYEDVITASGKNYFLGLKLNGSNQIEKAYACGLYNETTPFCIEGSSDQAEDTATKYESNKTLLQGTSLWNNTCIVETYVESGSTFCDPPTTGMVYANASSYGDVNTGVDDGNFCLVYYYGLVGCDGGIGG